MQTKSYECLDYKSRLYETNKDILLLDIFVNNKEKYKISFSYNDMILRYFRYKLIKISHYDASEDYDYEENFEEQKDFVKININKIFNIHDFCIFNAGLIKNIISVTLVNKNLLKEFTPQIDENKINLKWMTSWMK